MIDDDYLDDDLQPELSDVSPAVMGGAAYALYRHGQDRQTQQIVQALRREREEPVDVEVEVHLSDEPLPVNTRDVDVTNDEWDEFIGQEPLKRQLQVYIDSAKKRGAPMPHTLLASGFPGVGKTHMARLIAKQMGGDMVELMPPFDVYTLVRAAMSLKDHDVLFIDEIHKLADSGKRGAEILLKVLEEGVAFMPDGSRVVLPNITIIGATTDRDKLPEPVLDRFKVKPYYQPYSGVELTRIAIAFAFRHECQDVVDDVDAMRISFCCRDTPRIIEEMVLAQRDLSMSLGRKATPEELQEFLEVTPDGLTRTHIKYLTSLLRFFMHTNAAGEVEYRAGEQAMRQVMRETPAGLQRIEMFLVERGLLDKSARGRRLTDAGIERASEFLEEEVT